jgi:hypothetical protein
MEPESFLNSILKQFRLVHALITYFIKIIKLYFSGELLCKLIK